jgi:hypothetical protein
MKNKKLDDKTPLTWEQIQEKIKEYKINQEGINSINSYLEDGDPVTDWLLKNIASLHYMTKEILAAKIKEYKVPKWAVDTIYHLIDDGRASVDDFPIEMLEELGKHGRNCSAGFVLQMMT